LQGDAVGIFAATLKHSGTIQANAVSTEGGKVVLKGASTLDIEGSVQASALSQRGGSILASAQHVKLGGSALLDASGALGGGEVLVGGGYQGHDARIANAQTTQVEAGAQLRADALAQGDGGTVVVWSDDTTQYAGSISAQGGSAGGNGGIAEVSGKQYLDFQGLADLRAAQGTRGTLLLDPLNILISNTRTADIDGTGSGYGADIVSGSDLSNSATYGSATSQITATQVGTLLNTADVTLAATNDITVDSLVQKTGAAATTLKLDAGNNIVFNANVTSSGGSLGIVATAGNAIDLGYNTFTTAGGSVSLKANSGNVSGSGSIVTQGGNVTVNADYSIYASLIDVSGKNVGAGTAGSAGSINLSASSGKVSVTTLTANGGSGFSGIVNGGNGGSISVTANSDGSSCECSSDIGSISAVGGSGYGAGVSGSKGSVSLSFGQSLSMPTSISVGSLSYTSTDAYNSIDLSSTSLSADSANLSAVAGITATGLNLTSFSAAVTGSGNINFSNTGTLNLGALSAANGNITVDNTGGITTTGAVKAPNGSVSITAHSPITIGTAGVTAGSTITLSAPTTGPTSNITLNGVIQSTGGSISMSAANNLVQNSGVIAAGGITASATGTMSFGPNGYSSGSPLNYSDASGSISPPLVPLSSQITSGGSVSDFLDQFLAALDGLNTFSDDPFDPRNRRTAGLVVEGQICTP
jgi:hypothetical protein